MPKDGKPDNRSIMSATTKNIVEQKPQQKRETPKIQKSRIINLSTMNKGIKTVLYPVKDINQSKTVFRKLLGVEPYADQPYYVGFKIGDQDIGLVPDSPEAGMTAFYHVDDIKNSLQILVDGGAEIIQDVRNVGGGRLIASVKDKDSNIIGLVQN